MSEHTLLVFGGEGQVGRAFAETAPPPGWRIVTVGHADADVTDPGAVEQALRAHRPKAVVNAAAYTAVDKAESERDIAMRVNRDGAGIVARATAAAKLPLLHISTDYVFDGTKSGPWHEDDPVAPIGAYGVSKEAGERLIRESQPNHIILRTSWVFGCHGANFVKTMLRLAETRDELRIVADQHGKPTDAADVARALCAMAARLDSKPPRAPWGTFHFAGKRATTWFGFAEAIFEEAAKRGVRAPQLVPIATAEYPTPARRPANSVLDCAKIESVYGVIPRPWLEGLTATLDRLVGTPTVAAKA
ncbi:MAG: dTDP-4-dehydrorhamnose reductase [Gemmatimonas sp.]